jgi:hypothetical protein
MEEKYYTSSDGKKTLMKDVEFTHLTNGLAKRYRDIFGATSKEDYSRKVDEINDIKEEIHRRLNTFSEGLNNEQPKQEEAKE